MFRRRVLDALRGLTVKADAGLFQTADGPWVWPELVTCEVYHLTADVVRTAEFGGKLGSVVRALVWLEERGCAVSKRARGCGTRASRLLWRCGPDEWVAALAVAGLRAG